MPITIGIRRIVVSTVAVLIAGAVVAVLTLTSSPTSLAMPAHSPTSTMASDMPGMDHGDGNGSVPPTSPAEVPPKTHDRSGGDGHGSSPSPTTSPDGHGTEHDHGSSPSPTASPDGHGTEHGATHGTAEAAPDRPLAPVLGTFGGASSLVMLSAAFLRRKDRANAAARQAARAARKAQK